MVWFSAFRRGVSVTWVFVHTEAGLPWVRAALTTCPGGRALQLKPGWARALIDDFFFLYFCIFEMGWKDLKRSAHCHRAWATTCTVPWAPWSPENGTSLLPSKFSCQFEFPSVKPSHIVPLVEGSTFSGGNSEQNCSSKMPFGGAPPLSKGTWRVHKDHSSRPGEIQITTILPVLYHLPSCTDECN